VLDRWTLPLVRKPLHRGARFLYYHGIKADQITLTGFIIGIFCLPLLVLHWYGAALVCIVLNRLADGLDGEVARLAGPTDAGGFLDIVLDFIFYSSVVFGFALAEPEYNSLAAAALLFSFVGTGASFLSFAIMAERRSSDKIVYPAKGFFYLGGLAEGTETLLVLILFCLFPRSFAWLAYCFASVCLVTVLTRVAGGYLLLKQEG
jgi:phosphatidylglycerophosphate synthase